MVEKLPPHRFLIRVASASNPVMATQSAGGGSVSSMEAEPPQSQDIDDQESETLEDQISNREVRRDRSKNENGSVGSEWMFTQPTEGNTVPYSDKVAELLGIPPLSDCRPTSPEVGLRLKDIIKVHKARLDCVDTEPVDNLWALRRDEPSDLFIFVQDLDSEVIETVGCGLGILPTVFEDHFRQSGSLGRLPSGDPDRIKPTGHITDVPEIYASLRWFSIARPTPTLWDEDDKSITLWDHLLLTGGPVRRDRFRFEALGNLGREGLQLPDVQGRSEFQHCVAYEERVSFSVINRNTTNRDILVLMDPLFRVRRHEMDFFSGSLQETLDLTALESRCADRGPRPTNMLEFLKCPGKRHCSHQSTYQDMQAWLRYWKSKDLRTRPLDAIVRVIQADTLSLIELLSLTTRELYLSLHTWKSLGSKGRKDDWRRLLFWAQDVLPKVSTSMRETCQILRKVEPQVGPSRKLDSPSAGDSIDILEELIGQIGAISIRIEAVQGAFNAEMALIHSQKGIVEAESVKRLTELAFFFIPLTFAAASFSIQVHELSTSPPPIWVFFLTAACLVALVYGFRIARYPDEAREWREAWRHAWISITVEYQFEIQYRAKCLVRGIRNFLLPSTDGTANLSEDQPDSSSQAETSASSTFRQSV